MTRITNADHVLLLLRNHLERMQKQRRKRGKEEVPAQKSPAQANQLERVARLAAAEGVSEHEFQQALIAGLLADELGDAVTNDAEFVRLVDDVLAIIRRDPESSALLRAAQQHLSSS
jgi:hypothetical protein